MCIYGMVKLDVLYPLEGHHSQEELETQEYEGKKVVMSIDEKKRSIQVRENLKVAPSFRINKNWQTY